MSQRVAYFFMLAGFLLSLALVWRGAAGGWWRAYPVVLAYFVFTAANTVAVPLVFTLRPAVYAIFYWVTEGLYVVFGFGLIWQVYAAIPRQYPGVGRIIKTLAQGVAAAAPVLLVAAVVLSRRGTVTLDVLERNFRSLQAALICIVIGLALYYGIPLSRNLRALVRGLGLYIAIFIVRYTLWPMHYGGFWQYVMPAGYMAAQVVWLTGLWRYEDPAREVTDGEPETGTETYPLLIRLRRQLQRPFIHE